MTSTALWSPEPPAAWPAASWPGDAHAAPDAASVPWAARLLALSCFFPYPALAIGQRTGLQVSHALALAAVPALALRPPGRTFRALLALAVGPFVAALANVMKPWPPSDPGVMLKESVAVTLALLVIWPATVFATRQGFRALMVMAAVGVLTHALIGLYQVYAFEQGYFPLIWLYRNPAFKAMETWGDLYARYMKRPCALFPEPSAMAAALAPWVVLLGAQAAGAVPGYATRGKARWLTSAAAAGGFVLLALSRSGSALAIMACVPVAVIGGQARGAGKGRLLGLVVVVAGVAGVAGYVASNVGSGLDRRIESSWGLRGQSIALALTSNTDPLTFAFGVGPGESTPVIRSLMAGVPRAKEQDDMAVFSLAAAYYMETGALGGLILLGVLVAAVRAVARSSARALGLGATGAWLVGVTLTTSYIALSSMWLFLGLALEWDRVFPRDDAAEGGAA